MPDRLIPTPVYDSYWRFAAERQAIYHRRLTQHDGPWTRDPVLRAYRFTNAYRAADRVSQYLIREVQYGDQRSQAPDELFFRTLFFKFFNRIETWELVERLTGPISWQSADFERIETLLDEAMTKGRKLYSAAYIMPAPPFGRARKHGNHLMLLRRMMEDGLAGRIAAASGLEEAYLLLRSYPGIGGFLAFQYAIDLNYSTLTNFDEGGFVVAGPGALDGISKCFSETGEMNPEAIINEMVDRQDREFARLGLEFKYLFGRKLQPIDCQNLFCEISKYARVAHPEVKGIAGRERIKQAYQGTDNIAVQPFFPPKWKLHVPRISPSNPARTQAQGSLF